MQRPGDWQPPAELLDFLAAGPPPVFAGFGSLSIRHPERVAAQLIQAFDRCGQRGIIAGFEAADCPSLPATVYRLKDFVPHDWLFERISLAIHHAGAGTTAAALRSGVVQLPLPAQGDQVFWARQLALEGLSPRPIPFSKLTAPALRLAIEDGLTSTAMRQRAQQLAAHEVGDNGVDRAVAVVGDILSDLGRR